MELWLVDLEAAASALEALERQAPRLSADDRARAQRLQEPSERRLRLAAYMALRIVIERMGGEEVRGQPFARTPGGRPHLAAATPSFSLSHAGRLALLGVARLPPLGVDLEEHRALTMAPRRRREILAIGAGLARRPVCDGASDATLLQAWCRLEAYAKATGAGVARILTELGARQARGRQLAPCAIEAAARRHAAAGGLAVGDLKLPPGLHGAVAFASARGVARVRRFPTGKAAIVRLLAAARPAARCP
jgi:4'-phosphopantetheinyl transferase